MSVSWDKRLVRARVWSGPELGSGPGRAGSGRRAAPNDGSGISERDYDSSKGDNGSKPMTLWDFRTSSPPG